LPTPVGLMAAYDGLARRAVDACALVGRRVPDQVAALGVDNDEVVCEMASVPVSSVAVAAQRIGYEAAALVDRMIAGRDRDLRLIQVPPLSIVTRMSTDHLAVSDPLVTEAIRYIRGHADQPINVEDVAGALRVSRRNLEQRFSHVLRRSPAAEIRRAHIERACNLLETTDTPLGQVALMSGLADGPSLSRFFRREMGMNPSQYRSSRRLGV
jgi:LacI family transcriptional regulator